MYSLQYVIKHFFCKFVDAKNIYLVMNKESGLIKFNEVYEQRESVKLYCSHYLYVCADKNKRINILYNPITHG